MTESNEREFPLLLRYDPEAAHRALSMIGAAETLLNEFDSQVKRGIFRVSYLDQDKALTKAKEAARFLELVRSIPRTEIRFNVLCNCISLVDFVESGKTKTSLLNKILQQHRSEIKRLRSVCNQALRDSEEDQQRKILGDIWNELPQPRIEPQVLNANDVSRILDQ